MENIKQSYKDTINLPSTNFSMKANLPAREPGFIKTWEESELYRKILKVRHLSDNYILHDGPPYANGDIHMGHALNKILKDIVVKYKTMKGYRSPFVPGWDCHGLPVEHQLFKELKLEKHQIDKVVFRKKAHNFAMKFVELQKQQFKRLGIFGDWDNPYLTLNPSYEVGILEAFNEIVKNGYVYRGLKPIYWCKKCETALAEAEVEYNQHSSPSIYVKFKLHQKQTKKIDIEEVESYSFVIWTTTPWTLISNTAVALNPDLVYIFCKTDKGNLILAENLAESFQNNSGILINSITAKKKGLELQGLICNHPFLNRNSVVVLAAYVSATEGSGCVHIAGGHGQEDYFVSLEYKLPIVMPVDEKGKFDSSVEKFATLDVFKSNAPIMDYLSELGALLWRGKVEHSYPHCWRCKEPVITRATHQWFIGIDTRNLRNRLLDAIEKVNWYPRGGKSRISAMISLRPDWCISRQRYWGVPIPAFYCTSCKEAFLLPEVIQNFIENIKKSGSDCWFENDIKTFIPSNFVCPKCGGREFKREEDILDVWFDSGASHKAVLQNNNELRFPADLYLEGSDQHRGWFQASLITSICSREVAPYKSVLTHGFVVDGEGKKMSKSLGNVISPQEIISKYGADVLRLWVASSDYNDDVKISDEILSRLSDAYRKIRNTARFILGNLYDFDPKKDNVSYDEMLEIDRWILSKLSNLLEKIELAYEEFGFHKIYQLIYNFCTIELSSFYLDILKDRLYIYSTRSLERKSAQSAIYEILSVLSKIVAPILVFTADEIWASLQKDQIPESIHMQHWPKADSRHINIKLEEKWQQIMDVREFVLKAIEKKRESGIIGNSLEAEVVLSASDPVLLSLLKSFGNEQLKYIFIVSGVVISDIILNSSEVSTSMDGKLKIEVQHAKGKKCDRCWNWSETVGTDVTHTQLCDRCRHVLSTYGNQK